MADKLSLINPSDFLDAGRVKLNEAITKFNEAVFQGSVNFTGTSGSFETLTELQSNYPNGDVGVYVVSDTQSWYYWNGSLWIEGGPFPGNDIANESVDYLKFAPRTNIKSTFERILNKYVSTSGSTINFVDSPNFSVLKIPIGRVGRLIMPILETGGKYITATGPDDASVIYQKTYEEFLNGADFSRWGYTIDGAVWTLDQKIVGYQFLEEYIYITIANANWEQFYVYSEEVKDLKETIPYLRTDNINNESLEILSGKLQTIDFDVNHRNRMVSYNTTTGSINYEVNNNYAVFKLKNVPKEGSVRVPHTNFTTGQFIILTDASDRAVRNFGWQYTQDREDTLIFQNEGKIEISLKNIINAYPNVVNIYIAMFGDDIFDFFPESVGTTQLTDVFKWANVSGLGSETKILLPPNYPILQGQSAYVYLDNVLQNGCAYDETNVHASKMLGTQLVGLVESNDSSISITTNETKVLPVNRIPSSAGSGQSAKVMIIGESTSESTYLLNAISDHLANDVVDFELVGSKTNGGIVNEARSGWGSGTLRYVESALDRTNAFFDASKGEFDFQYYLDSTGVAMPDIVAINFGINEPNREVPGGLGADQVANYEFFINNIRAVNPNVKIIIGLTHSSSRFGNFRRLARREVILARTEATIKAFKGRENEGIYLAPYYLNIDPIWDMQYEEIPLNVHQPTLKDYQGTDQVHPSETGYKKMADVLYWAIKSTF